MGHGSAIGGVQFVLLTLLGFIVLFALLAKRIDKPYPIVLTVAGFAFSFVPGMPRVTLDPEIIFLVVLPPLLYSAAWVTSWRDFRYNLVSILLLAFGLVAFTVFGVALIGPKLLPGFDWPSAFALGAVVSTTDAIAATSIAKRVGLPKRIVDLLEGESLVNDASGLLALEFGLAFLASGRMPGPGLAIWRLTVLIVAGVTIGLAVGFVVDRLERYIEDVSIEIAITLLVPYGVYLAAEWAHVSGVLAVIACGLYLSRRSSDFFSPAVRIQAYGLWSSLTFLLNGFVFVMIGLQLPTVLAQMDKTSLRSAIVNGLALSALLIVLRLLWAYPGAMAAHLIRKRLLHQNIEFPPLRSLFVVGWTGMRGVVALAAALSLPRTIEGGRPFAQRDSIIFFTFVVILVTLVVQGLTLAPLIRLLRLASADKEQEDCEENEARRLVIEEALNELRSLQEKDGEEFHPVYDHIEKHYKHRLFNITRDGAILGNGTPAHVDRFEQVSSNLRRLERETALSLRRQGRINDETLRVLEREMDLIDLRLEAHGA